MSDRHPSRTDGVVVPGPGEDIWNLDRFIRWLETMPAGETYCWIDPGGCLLHSYLTDRLGPVVEHPEDAWSWQSSNGTWHVTPITFRDIVLDGDDTYAAAFVSCSSRC